MKIINQKRMRFHSTLWLILLAQFLLSCSGGKKYQSPQVISDGKYLLPNGWKLSPAGREINLGGLPLNIVLVPNTHYAVVTSNGYTDHFLALVDLNAEQIVDRHIIKQGWIGLAVSNDGERVYASAGGKDRILVFNVKNKRLDLTREISLPNGMYPSGLSLGSDNRYLYVVGNHNNKLLQINLSTNQIISSWEVGTTPYTCIISSDLETVFVSNWGENSVSVVDLTKQEEVKKIIVKDHPNDLIFNSDENFLYVACGNWNIVSVIDLNRKKVIEEIEISLFPGAPPGSTPNALALSPNGKELYVANADNNCLAVIDVSNPHKSTPLGFIPTGWYPTAIAISKTGEKIIVANGKGSVSSPSGDKSKGLPGESIHGILEGTLSFIDKPDVQQIDRYSKQVYSNTPYLNKNRTLPSPPFSLGDNSPIKYVFYIIKENRTYDQIFGDMEIGNGDPSYCYFPEEVTPNHHALARKFVLFDNLYHDAEVSADGHFWSTAAYATDYVEKSWPSSYGGKGSPRLQYHDDSIAYPSSGFLWDLCAAKGITYRSYGEFVRVWIPKGDEKYPSLETMETQQFSSSEEDYKRGMKIRPATRSLEGHYNTEYTGADYVKGMSDSTRFNIWIKEFHQFIKEGEMPKFTVLSLPGDHLLGTQPGVQTPRAMMAENDLILGKMVEEISHSPFWDQTAIFVIEDDPQSGPDHVDCHRTVALVISPYTQQGIVDNTMYSSSSMLRTMEEILGLPPLTQYDASATPMWNAFKSKPDFTPYTALKNRIPLNELNSKNSFGAQKSLELTLGQADTAPDDEYNRILWYAIMGEDKPFPPRKRAAFVIVNEEE
ncbi:MAG: bifunctional YncE family protein/alkaline phosphatase family protein [Draconibacterium sp.]|nr:bifunctional YncE family protein/alkaline phosphatase family protein [Draconibacterium sp.]